MIVLPNLVSQCHFYSSKELEVTATFVPYQIRDRSVDIRATREHQNPPLEGLVYSWVRFPHSPILHYAYSSWIKITMAKTIDCL